MKQIKSPNQNDDEKAENEHELNNVQGPENKPDFCVIYTNHMLSELWIFETPPTTIDESLPNRYEKNDNGEYRYRLAEEFFAKLGIECRVITEADISKD